MKIKDLPPDTNLRGKKIRTTNGREGYWWSQWQKGVWIKYHLKSKNVYPIFLDNLGEAAEWEVLEEEKEPIK